MAPAGPRAGEAQANAQGETESGRAQSGRTQFGSANTRAPEDLAADIERLKADIAKLTEQLRQTGQHTYGAARRAAGEGIEQLKAQGEAAYEQFRENAGDFERQLADTVREKPVTSLAIAAGVGFLLALMTRR
jgi:ElaB/YqjD/DUF883 family membrane-anchored ribosome-binding protein